ncbi:murein transglycosylase A [Azospirillum sp.]|uniref:murein transglycosylase A n=1 Tax=Azospirillum sp. TaxID=34012 RepID=UPI003D7416DD
MPPDERQDDGGFSTLEPALAGKGIAMAQSAGCGVRRVLARVSCLLAMGLAACTTTGDRPVAQGGSSAHPPVSLDLIAADFRTLPGWAEDDHAEALAAFHRSCDWLRGQSPDRRLGKAGTVGDWQPACAAARTLPAGDREAARTFFETHFTPVSLGGGTEGLFTGYYEAELHGSWTRTDRYTVPLYRTPPRTKRGIPTRERIVNGALKGKGLELLWVDDPIDAFFLEIQGSGRIRMTDGSVIGVHYAGQNGRPYYPIGRHLIDEGIATPEQVTLQLIRSWLKANPGQAKRVMNMNQSYVFFRTRDSDVGARGALNTRLVPGRSLAVDPSHVPLGVPLWLEAKDVPVPGGEIRRLVVAQDTGGAIKGEVRGDLFWGPGAEAADAAGLMKARGRYTMLVPRRSVQTAQR